MSEIWRAIPGYEGKYEASSLGRIKSLDRVMEITHSVINQHMKEPKFVLVKRKVKGRIKKLTIGDHGYPVVNLGLRDVHTVHTLVAKTFLKRIDGKNHVDHINSVRTDNRVENLQWVTQQENNAKQRRIAGSDHHNSILTKEDVRHIRDEHDRGFSQTKIAEGYGVSKGTISDIIARRTWKHV